jgi:hypothetical protein
MKAHDRVTAAIRAANEAGRTGLVPFVTAGYPEPKDFISTLKAVAEVGDVVEVGIPFSDPMADGMTIQRSSFEALRKGVSLAWIFGELEKAGGFDAPLVMMSYLNPLLAFGYDRLADRALETGVCAFIVPDLPFEESDEIRAALEAKGLGLIQLVTPATPQSYTRSPSPGSLAGTRDCPMISPATSTRCPALPISPCVRVSASAQRVTLRPWVRMPPAPSSVRRWSRYWSAARIRQGS